MAWGRFDDSYPMNRKVRPLSDAAFRLDVSAILWSSHYGTDGQVPAADLGAVSDVKRPAKAVGELVARGRWHEPDHDCQRCRERCPDVVDGWVIHDFLDYNPSQAEATKVRTKRADAGRRGGQASGKTKANPKQFASASASKPEAQDNQTAKQTASKIEPRTPSPFPVGEGLGSYVASGDARETAADPPPGQPTIAEQLTAAYAAGVPLADHSRALRTIVRALATYDPAMVQRGVEQLVAEQRTCSVDQLRIAMLAASGNWAPPGSAGQQRPSTTDRRVRAALDLADRLGDETGTPPLRALPGGLA